MGDQVFLKQNIFKEHLGAILLSSHHATSLDVADANKFLSTAQDGIVGVAPAYGAKCRLVAIAFASPTMVLLIRLPVDAVANGSDHWREVFRTILQNDTLFKVGIRVDRLVASLLLDHGLEAGPLVDLYSLNNKEDRDNAFPLISDLVGESRLNKKNLGCTFLDEKADDPERTALRAWVVCKAAIQHATVVVKTKKMNTGALDRQFLKVLSTIVRDQDRLDSMKPTVVKHDVKKGFKYKDGQLHVQSTRYKTRIRFSAKVHIQTENGAPVQKCSVTHVKGRAVAIKVKGPFGGSAIHSIKTLGKDRSTNAESKRCYIVWLAFYGGTTLQDQYFFRALWLPAAGVPRAPPSTHASSIHFSARTLNPLQQAAVRAITSDTSITLIHGPPGTGKTTVIAAAVSTFSRLSPNRGIWLVAHSNVAVKTIAEKLASVGFLGFRLLVSEDFHFDWHEHLYKQIDANVTKSSEFPKDITAIQRLLLDTRVILCTLSMLANPGMRLFARVVPVETAIVDEASQIEIGDYIPLIYNFGRTLVKLVFIGDDKQLAPYGQEQISGLRSIFEVPSLRHGAVFLNTQYRMPHVIGGFISRQIYDGKLKTEHAVTSRGACRFVDVLKGVEQQSGHSWINTEEAHAAVRVAQKFYKEGKKYRIITPYDPQRNLIENELKAANLPWEDGCFTVDSSQGSEEEHIILSLVRSNKIGFLNNTRRANVMLSRCKQSMVICSSRGFIGGAAAGSLVGKLAKECGPKAWVPWKDVLNDSW